MKSEYDGEGLHSGPAWQMIEDPPAKYACPQCGNVATSAEIVEAGIDLGVACRECRYGDLADWRLVTNLDSEQGPPFRSSVRSAAVNMGALLIGVAFFVLCLLVASGAAGQVCPWTVTLRAEDCPVGQDCVTKESSLLYSEMDRNLLNISGLCSVADVLDPLSAFTWPGVGAGVFRSDGAGLVALGAAAGVGACPSGQVVSSLIDGAAPVCTPKVSGPGSSTIGTVPRFTVTDGATVGGSSFYVSTGDLSGPNDFDGDASWTLGTPGVGALRAPCMVRWPSQFTANDSALAVESCTAPGLFGAASGEILAIHFADEGGQPPAFDLTSAPRLGQSAGLLLSGEVNSFTRAPHLAVCWTDDETVPHLGDTATRLNVCMARDSDGRLSIFSGADNNVDTLRDLRARTVVATTHVGALSGNASTASALAANGSNCASGLAAQGTDAAGNAEGCFPAATSPAGSPGEIQVNASGAFGADPDLSWNTTTNVLQLAGLSVKSTSTRTYVYQTPTTGTFLCIGGDGTDTNTACLESRNDSGTASFWAKSAAGALGRFVGKGIAGSGGGGRFVLDEDRGGLRIWRDGSMCFSSSNTDAVNNACDTGATRATAAVWKLSDALALTPRSSPPVTCGAAGSASVIYYDSDSSSFCGCNGTTWAPGFGTAGPCE